MTTNSSPSLDKRFFYGPKHLHTINEGNSSEVSDSNTARSSLLIKDSSSKKSSSRQALEHLTRAKLQQRQAQLILEEGLTQALNRQVQDNLKGSMISERSSHLLATDLHLTGDLLASNEDSLRFAPDFSLEDPSINIRKPAPRTQNQLQEEDKQCEESHRGQNNNSATICQRFLPLHSTQPAFLQSSSHSRSLSSGGMHVEKARNASVSEETVIIGETMLHGHAASSPSNEQNNTSSMVRLLAQTNLHYTDV